MEAFIHRFMGSFQSADQRARRTHREAARERRDLETERARLEQDLSRATLSLQAAIQKRNIPLQKLNASRVITCQKLVDAATRHILDKDNAQHALTTASSSIKHVKSSIQQAKTLSKLTSSIPSITAIQKSAVTAQKTAHHRDLATDAVAIINDTINPPEDNDDDDDDDDGDVQINTVIAKYTLMPLPPIPQHNPTVPIGVNTAHGQQHEHA